MDLPCWKILVHMTALSIWAIECVFADRSSTSGVTGTPWSLSNGFAARLLLPR